MEPIQRGAVAVIFASLRNGQDEAGYAAASAMMDAEAARQPGYLGMEAVRDAGGVGITISYWADEAAALAWRAHAAHRVTRDRGRADWYDRYRVIVTEVSRSYIWERERSSRVDPGLDQEPAMDKPTSEQTTGKTMLETRPPAPAGTGAIPARVDDHAAQDAVIESTSVQGAPADE